MTVAFGTTAPVESVTVPVKAPVEAVCAVSEGAEITKQQSNNQTTHTDQFSLMFSFGWFATIPVSGGAY